MTRKDYWLIAGAMRYVRPSGAIERAQWLRDCYALADMLAAQSRGFDRDQFLDNCGVNAP